jgi:CheY-like chemotaxis protein
MKIDTTIGAKTRWMIVDDDAGVLMLLSAFVAQLTNAEIGCFSSPHEAVTAFAEAPEKFQFVITDLEMPGLDGIQLCRRLRAISPKIKVLLATGSRLLTNAEAVQNGFCGLVQKPLRGAAMKQALAAAGIGAAARANFSSVLTLA